MAAGVCQGYKSVFFVFLFVPYGLNAAYAFLTALALTAPMSGIEESLATDKEHRNSICKQYNQTRKVSVLLELPTSLQAFAVPHPAACGVHLLPGRRLWAL